MRWILRGFTLALLPLAVTPPLQADRFVVEPGTAGGTVTGPFTAWTNAATSIQLAVDAANDGETIWVSNGRYDLSSEITIDQAVMVRGADPAAHPVVNGGGAVRCFNLTGAGACLRDLTISNGNACAADGGGVYLSGPGASLLDCRVLQNVASKKGGGVYIASSVGAGGIVSNCTIRGNITTNSSSNTDGGGGVYMAAGVLQDSLIAENRVLYYGGTYPYYGGGAFCIGGRISNCQFLRNQAGLGGGGLLYKAGDGITDCSFLWNTNLTGFAGGAILTQSGLTLDGCTIVSNQGSAAGGATRGGGGISCVFSGATLTVLNSTVAHNISSGSGGGGGINLNESGGGSSLIVSNSILGFNRAPQGGGIRWLKGGRMTVHESLIFSNEATSTSGGGAHLELSDNSASEALLERVRILGNTAKTTGGGLHSAFGATLRSCLISENESQSNGGGLYLVGTLSGAVNELAPNRVESCTIAGNRAATSGSGIYLAGEGAGDEVWNSIVHHNCNTAGAPDDCLLAGDSTNRIWYSCCGAVLPHPSNLDADPRFADAADGNYRLRGGSPCIDAGTNRVSWMTGAFDLDGHPRLGISGRTDMGCFEYLPLGTRITIR